jgi:hypothetical protein
MRRGVIRQICSTLGGTFRADEASQKRRALAACRLNSPAKTQAK